MGELTLGVGVTCCQWHVYNPTACLGNLRMDGFIQAQDWLNAHI
jgi:hypothetical protein